MASDDERPALEEEYHEPKKGKNGKRSRDIEEEEEEDEDDIFEEDEEEVWNKTFLRSGFCN